MKQMYSFSVCTTWAKSVCSSILLFNQTVWLVIWDSTMCLKVPEKHIGLQYEKTDDVQYNSHFIIRLDIKTYQVNTLESYLLISHNIPLYKKKNPTLARTTLPVPRIKSLNERYNLFINRPGQYRLFLAIWLVDAHDDGIGTTQYHPGCAWQPSKIAKCQMSRS